VPTCSDEYAYSHISILDSPTPAHPPILAIVCGIARRSVATSSRKSLYWKIRRICVSTAKSTAGSTAAGVGTTADVSEFQISGPLWFVCTTRPSSSNTSLMTLTICYCIDNTLLNIYCLWDCCMRSKQPITWWKPPVLGSKFNCCKHCRRILQTRTISTQTHPRFNEPYLLVCFVIILYV
jgi:hypothetical protein